MSIGGMGTWHLHSESDPRWNASGRAFGSTTAGGPIEWEEWLEARKAELGESPPADLTISWMKD